MKKFFSILCALTIVLSASAAPVAKKAQAAKFQRAAVEQQMRKANKVSAEKLLALKTLKVADNKLSSTLRAPKAKAEVIDVKCGSWEIEDWGTDGELYLYGEDNTYAFYFDLIYGDSAADLQLGKTYTAEDIYVGSDGQYGAVFYEGDWHYGIKELSLVKTIDEKGLVHFAGSCVDSLDAAFTFHYDEEEFVPTGDTIQHIFLDKAKLSYNASYKEWTITAQDSQYAFKLDILSENDSSVVGNYTKENFDLNYTQVEVFASPDSSNLYFAKDAKASVFVENDTTIILAEILAEDGIVYSFAAFYAVPSKQAEGTINATNLVLDDTFVDWFGVVIASANSDFYGVGLYLYPESNDYLGNYTIGENASGDVIVYAQDSLEVEIYSGSFNLATSADTLKLTGKVLCYNDVEYTLNLAYIVPEANRQETLAITNAVLTIYPEYGDWQITGFNADSSRYAAIDIISDAITGTFTEDDMDPQYTYIANVISRNDSLLADEQFIPLKLNITVAFNATDSTATITGTYRGQGYKDATDVPEFTLNIIAKVETYQKQQGGGNQYDSQDQGFYYKFPTYTTDDQYLADYNVLIVDAIDAENHTISLEINVEEGATELAAGVYNINNSGAAGTVTAGTVDQYIYGSFAGNLNAAGQITVPLWLLNSGTVTVLANGVIEVAAFNTWGAGIFCRLGEYPEAIENTDAAVKAAKHLENGVLIIEKNGVKYNAQGAILK